MSTERNVRTFSVEIDRSAAEVFAYISDITRHGDWSPTELRIEPVAPGRPIAVGEQYRSFGFTGPKPFENLVEITEFEPDKRFGFSAQTQNIGAVRHTFVLTPTLTGVRVDRIIDMRRSHGIAALLEAVFVTPQSSKTMGLLRARFETAGDADRAARKSP